MQLPPQPKPVENLHTQPYLITVRCEVYKATSTGLTHRGIVFRVMRNVGRSALVQLVGANKGGDQWENVRDAELFMNGPFAQFENQIRELFRGPWINTDATFVLRYGNMLDNVRREYMLANGFSSANVPWRDLAQHYTYADPLDATAFKRRRGFDPTAKSGFEDAAYIEAPNTYADKKSADFEHEELKQAEQSAHILKDVGAL